MTDSPPKRASLARFLPLVIVAGLVAVFFAALFMGDPGRLPSAFEGQKLPPFSLSWQGQEEALTNADLATGKPVLLNVFASWCGPCRDEHPYLMQLAQKGVAIYGLNLKDSPDAAQRFLSRLGNPYQKIGSDINGRTAIDLGVYGVPETFVLDGRGRVLLRYSGPLTEAVLKAEILPYLQQ
jgi:cytochrome c biogenesis protein CcmG, thiol:disulfide interchange protein DsbE